MQSASKRSQSEPPGSVSPPVLKRRAVISSPKRSDVGGGSSSFIRIFSWNVNGVGALLQKQLSFTGEGIFPLRSFLKRHQWPHIVGLQEVKINAKDEITQNSLRRAANAGQHPGEPSYLTHFSLPRDRYNALGFNGKVYGVATLVREDFVHSLVLTRKPEWDLEGRVLIHELNNGLVVINGYWVNGTTNAYKNPESGIEEGTRHDHKLRFHQHMLDECLKLRRNGLHILLIGDMNIAPSKIDGHPNLRTSPLQHVRNRADFNEKFLKGGKGLEAVDIFRELHGQTKKYTYYPRGLGWGNSCDRVDLIIADTSLTKRGAITAADICNNPKDRGHSDHVPLWVEVNLSKLSYMSIPTSELPDDISGHSLS